MKLISVSGQSGFYLGSVSDLADIEAQPLSLVPKNIRLFVNCGVDLAPFMALTCPQRRESYAKNLATHKIPCLVHLVPAAVAPGASPLVTHLFFEMWNDQEEQLSPCFAPLCKAIDECVSRKGSILLYCDETGSRSAALLMAYLMFEQDLSASEVYSLLLTRFPSVDMNPGFDDQLNQLGQLLVFYKRQLQAKSHAHSSAGSASSASSSTSPGTSRVIQC